MGSNTANPNQLPRNVTAMMLAGGVLMLAGAAGQLMANYALQERPFWLLEILTGVCEILVGVGLLCAVLGAWRWWQWSKSENSLAD